MGREIKRVALDFDWPLGHVWKGFLNPHYEHAQDCPFCKGSGMNPQTKQIDEDWYDFAGTGREWCHNLEESEVEALCMAGRLPEFIGSGHYDKEQGKWVVWQNGEKVDRPTPELPSPEAVNAWSMTGFGHDSINRWICVEVRAKRLGVYGNCDYCHGDGTLWRSPEDKANAESWQSTEPPDGPGYQVWETVSEGSPISPVFKDANDLVCWLNESEGYSLDAAINFVHGSGWAPSGMFSTATGYLRDIESCRTS